MSTAVCSQVRMRPTLLRVAGLWLVAVYGLRSLLTVPTVAALWAGHLCSLACAHAAFLAPTVALAWVIDAKLRHTFLVSLPRPHAG